MTLGEYLAEWVKTLPHQVARRTVATYEQTARLHLTPALGRLRLEDLSRNVIRDFVLAERERGRSASTTHLYLAILRRALQDAVDADPPLLAHNPALHLWRRMPAALRRVHNPAGHALPPGAAHAILAYLEANNPMLWRLAMVYARTGCRRSEALGLQVGDLDFRARTITIARQWHGGWVGIPKGRRPRTIDMADTLVPILQAAIIASPSIARRRGVPLEPQWVFRSGKSGLPWSPRHATKTISDAALAVIGRPVGPKAFRHSLATVLMHAGESPRYVQLTLGHSSIATTMGYVAHRGIRKPSALSVLDDPNA